MESCLVELLRKHLFLVLPRESFSLFRRKNQNLLQIFANFRKNVFRPTVTLVERGGGGGVMEGKLLEDVTHRGLNFTPAGWMVNNLPAELLHLQL